MAPEKKRKRASKFDGTGPKGKKLGESAQSADNRAQVTDQTDGGEFGDHEEKPIEPSKERKTPSSSKEDVPARDNPPPKKTKRSGAAKGDLEEENQKDSQSGEKTEKRLRRFRPHAPGSYFQIAERALTQRLCVLERKRTGTPEEPEETIEIAGSTGNIYTVRINRIPSCDCPHALKGHQCKHIIYVMTRTLRAPEDLVYQLALLSTEVVQILADAPAIPSEKAADVQEDPNRKAVSEACPFCCVDFDTAKDDIIWCKAMCGNNVHRRCFETWARIKRAQQLPLTCPFCRTPWQEDELGKSLKSADADMGSEGYRNVARQLGLSGERDYSTYHHNWGRGQS